VVVGSCRPIFAGAASRPNSERMTALLTTEAPHTDRLERGDCCDRLRNAGDVTGVVAGGIVVAVVTLIKRLRGGGTQPSADP
jgi:hypothetical protein